MTPNIHEAKKNALAAMGKAATKGNRKAFGRAQAHYLKSCDPREERDVNAWVWELIKVAENPSIGLLGAAKLAKRMYLYAPSNTRVRDTAQTLHFDYALFAMNDAATKGDGRAFGEAQWYYLSSCDPYNKSYTHAWAKIITTVLEKKTLDPAFVKEQVKKMQVFSMDNHISYAFDQKATELLSRFTVIVTYTSPDSAPARPEGKSAAVSKRTPRP
ncbi:MAG: hypothetical protein WC612_05760 [Bdellovibrionales bacterium]|jgi:hypothetical protein